MLNLGLLAFVVGCVLGWIVGGAWEADYQARPPEPRE